MARSPKTPELPASPAVTLTPEALQQLLGEAVSKAKAELMATLDAQKAEAKAANGKSETSTKNELQAIRAFRKAGFGTLTPHTDIMTYNRWLAIGFKVKEGSRSVRVGNLRLFCKAQVRPLAADERKALQQQSADAVARHEQASKQPASTAKGKVVSIAEAHPQ